MLYQETKIANFNCRQYHEKVTSSSAKFEESTDEHDKNGIQKQRKVNPEIWKDIEKEDIHKIPEELNGFNGFSMLFTIHGVSDIKTTWKVLSSHGRLCGTKRYHDQLGQLRYDAFC